MRSRNYTCAFFVALMVGASFFLVSPAYASMGITPSSLNFGSVSVNTASSAGVFTLTNYGKHNLTIQRASSNLQNSF